MVVQWVALLFGCGVSEVAVDVAVSQAVRVVEATAPPAQRSHRLFGSLQPVSHALLSASTGGEVVSIPTDVGEQVSRGDILVQLNATVTRAQVALAQAALEESAFVLRDAERQLSRAMAVTEQRSAAQTDAVVLGHHRAESAYKRAEANLKIAIHANRNKRIQAPFSGELVQVFPVVGELLVPGAPVARIADTSSLEIELGLSATEAAQFDAATAIFEVVVGDVRAAATLKHAASVADPRTRTWPLTLALPKTAGFVAGAPASVSVTFPTPKADAMVPLSALSEGRVWTVTSGHVSAETVTLVSEIGTYGLVRGVSVGATVVLSPPELSDGERVTVLGDSSP
jgi:RND family efflux transporter MFP subunit